MLLALAVLLCSGAALAEATRVAICVSEGVDDRTLAVETRLRAELSSAGFEPVFTRDVGAEEDGLARAAAATRSAAAIRIAPAPNIAAELWVADFATGKGVVRHLSVSDTSAENTAVFALRAVEVLRATLLELEAARSASTGAPGDKASAPIGATREPDAASASSDGHETPLPFEKPAERPIPARSPTPGPQADHALPASSRSEPTVARPRFEALAGAVVLSGSATTPATVSAAATFTWSPVERWAASLVAWAPSFGHLRGPEGSTSFDRELLLAYLEYTPLPFAEVRPFARAGAGVSSLGVRGDASAPYRSGSDRVWSGAGAAGLGARLLALRPIVVLAGADVALLAPKPGIEVAGRTAASFASPAFAGSIEVGGQWR